MIIKVLNTLALLFLLFEVEAQTPVLVKDIINGVNYSPINATVVGNNLLFTAGGKLWKSDGTNDGTVIIKDVAITSFFNDSPDNIKQVINNNLYFSGRNPMGLWKTDGTTEGTVLILIGDYSNGAIQEITNVNGILYFFTYAPSVGSVKLWKLSPIQIPVHLLAFTAKPFNQKVQLDWKTATEINTLGYDIERSTDGQTWKILGFVGAKNRPSDYLYLDENPNIDTINYYRLNTLDVDGKKEYSKIISVKMNNLTSSIRIFPTNTDGLINIETTLIVQEIWVTNSIGQIVLTVNQPSINLTSLPTGIYIVTVKTTNSIVSETVFKR